MKPILCLIAALILAPMAVAQSVKVSLKTQPKAGEKVTAIVEAAGDVTVESDVAQATFVAKGSGKREVDLGNGKVARIGFHRVRVLAAGGQASLLIPILSDATVVPSPKPSPLPEPDAFALTKFFGNLKKNGRRYRDTWPAHKTLVSNIVKVTTAGTLVLVCAAEPSKLTCVAAAASTADLALEVTFDFAGHAVGEMEKEGSLTKADADAVRATLLVLKGAKIAVSVYLGEGIAERVVEGLEIFTLPLDDDGIVKLTFGLQKDTAGKAVKLIQVLHKK